MVIERSAGQAHNASSSSRWWMAIPILGIVVHLLFLISLRTGWLNPFFDDSMHRFGPGGDFFSIYASGVQARQGLPVYLLDGHVSAVPYGYPFRYAPLVAYTLALALSYLPAITAYGVWIALCELALLRNIRITLECAPNARGGAIAVGMWLCFTPYFLELYVGQFTFITASLVFWAFMEWRKAAQGAGKVSAARGRWGDLFWACAVWLKMMPVLFLPIMFLRGRSRGAILTLVVLLTTSVLYFKHFPADWHTFLVMNADAHPASHAGNHGLMALLYAVGRGDMNVYLHLRRIAILIVGAMLLLLIYRAWQACKAVNEARIASKKTKAGNTLDASTSSPLRTEAERRLLYLFAGLSTAHPLLYKDVWEHHYVLLLAPLVLLALWGESARVWLAPYLISAIPGIFVFVDITGLFTNEDPQNHWHHAVSLLHHGVKPIAAVWLLVALTLLSVKLPIPVWLSNTMQQPRPRLAWRLAKGAALVLTCVCLLIVVRWAARAIGEQRRETATLVVPLATFEHQRTTRTCGPSAVASVCRFFGVPTTEEEIARLAHTTDAGTSMLGLREAAKAKGLSAEGWRVRPEELARTPRPCILFLSAGHFVILTGVRGTTYYIADPSRGQRSLSLVELCRRWHGETLVLGPPNFFHP